MQFVAASQNAAFLRDANTNTMSESIGELRLPANTAVPTHSNVARLQYLQALLDQVSSIRLLTHVNLHAFDFTN